MSISVDDIALLSRWLDEAQTLDPVQRELWLEGLAPEHARLAPMLREMIDGSSSAARSWELPALSEQTDRAEQQGERVGPYRLLKLIGTGGMGNVWLAERADGHFDRQVALKLPHRQSQPGLAARVARERQIVALLEHPHIARMYDAGFDEQQRHYIAMEYVDGQSIDAWCDAHACEVPARLRLFLQVARAVAFAHRAAVVHRDLKPANILVDNRGQTRLLDFGIANRIDECLDAFAQTEEVGRRLTRRYASPEQIAGEPTGVATDIYSLGVLLYELLAGVTPYALERSTTAALEEAILQGHLPLASNRAADPARRRALRGDLDAILAKALQREPSRRYVSADALADDIERTLAGDRILASSVGWQHTARRLVVRHRFGLAVALLVSVTSGAGVLATRAQALRAANEAEHARIVTEFVGDLFRRQADAALSTPAAAATIESTQNLQWLVKLIEERFARRPAVQAQLYGAAARIYTDIGAGRLGVDLAYRQMQILDRMGAGPSERAGASMQLAAAHSRSGQFTQAEAAARTAVALLPDAGTADGLEARAVLAGILLPAGQHAQARRMIAEVETGGPLLQRAPSIGLAKMVDVQGRLLEIDNHFEPAIAAWQQAADIAIAVQGPLSNTASRIRIRMAAEGLARNRFAEARLDMLAATQALQSSGSAGRVQAAVAGSTFASAAFSMGHMGYAEARAIAEAARTEVASRAAGLPAQVLANIEVEEGAMALRHGDLVVAAQLLQRAVPIVAATTDGLIDKRWLASRLGSLAMETGQHDVAASFLQERRDLRIRAGDGKAPFAAYDWVLLAHNELMRGDAAAAEAVLAQAPVFGALTGDTQSGAAYANAVQEQRTRIHLQRGDAAAALVAMPPPYGLAPIEDRSVPALAPYALRGEVLCAAGDAAAGLPIIQASIAALAPMQSPASPALARLRAVAGLCALTLGRRQEARELAQLSRAAFSAQGGVSDWFRIPLRRLDQALASVVASPGISARVPFTGELK